MNKKIVLIISHFGSGSSSLCEVLEQNERIVWCKSNLIYNHPDIIEKITNIPHKINNSAALWMDEILVNYMFSCKALYSLCKFVYLIRDARSTLNEIVTTKKSTMYNYYTYRLHRMCEMARESGGILLRWEDQNLAILEDYLMLKTPLVKPILTKVKDNPLITNEINRCEQAYEWYYYYLRNKLIM